MSEQPIQIDPDEEPRQELIDYNSGYNENFIPEDDAFHEAYAAAKAKGILSGYQIAAEESAKENAKLKADNQKLAFETAEANQRAEQAIEQAEHDPLTGLLNKAGFKKALHEKFELSKNGEVGILFIDLKDFKKANDDFGHEYGDNVLVITADVLKSTLRTDGPSHDIITFESEEERKKAGRLGGDEFAIIVDLTAREYTDYTPEERLAIVAQRLKDTFTQNEDIRASGVGMSIGGAVWEGQAPDELLKQADAAMYNDKREQQEREGSYR